MCARSHASPVISSNYLITYIFFSLTEINMWSYNEYPVVVVDVAWHEYATRLRLLGQAFLESFQGCWRNVSIMVKARPSLEFMSIQNCDMLVCHFDQCHVCIDDLQ